MKSPGAIAIAVAILGICCSAALGEQQAESESSDALGPVIQMLTDLRQKVQADKGIEGKTYRKFKVWCDKTENDAHFVMETKKKQEEKLQAKILKLGSDIDQAVTKIEDLVTSISESETHLKSSAEVRATENQVFISAQKDLMEMQQALEHAIPLLSSKSSAALAQVNYANIETALGTMMEAASFSTSDRNKLIALVQSKAKTTEDADDAADIAALGAPTAAAYSKKSGGILEILEGMRDEGEAQLAKLRTAEIDALNAYALTKQSLQDRLVQDNKELEGLKQFKSTATEDKAEVDGDHASVMKGLKEATKEHETIQTTCVESAADHEKTRMGRDAELNGLQEAIDTLRAAAKSAPSFAQVAAATTTSRYPVVAAVRLLAKEQHSTSLAQLASRIASVMRNGNSSGKDPFSKVKDLIKDMIFKIESKMNKEAEAKKDCDDELKKVGFKEEDLSMSVAELKATIDHDETRLAQIRALNNGLDSQLTDISRDQSELDELRQEQAAEYKEEKADLEKGLGGVRQALNKLKELYGRESEAAVLLQQPAKPEKYERSTGAGHDIIQMLKVIESELAKGLAELDGEEADAQAEYDKLTAENKIVQAGTSQEEHNSEQKEKVVKSDLSEVETDKRSTSSELDAVETYLHGLKGRCQAKPDKHEERAAKRKQTIKGLKNALTILKREASVGSFLQRRSGPRGLPSLD